MKLRKPCEHGHYEEHTDIPERDPADPIGTIRGPFFPCPGGVFLPDDTLICQKETGAWFEGNRLTEQAQRILLAHLSVREAE